LGVGTPFFEKPVPREIVGFFLLRKKLPQQVQIIVWQIDLEMESVGYRVAKQIPPGDDSTVDLLYFF
jgi:hypothetical protein